MEFDGPNELYVLNFWQCHLASGPVEAGRGSISHLCVDPFPGVNPDYDFAEA